MLEGHGVWIIIEENAFLSIGAPCDVGWIHDVERIDVGVAMLRKVLLNELWQSPLDALVIEPRIYPNAAVAF